MATSDNLREVLSGSSLDYAHTRGTTLEDRCKDFYEWRRVRLESGVWPYARSLQTAVGPVCILRDEANRGGIGINFASQDYLGLSRHPAVIEAAQVALRDFGLHSGGSPNLTGNSSLSLQLERALGEALQMEYVVLFPTGWSAAFGTIAALLRHDDHVIMDYLAHASLQQGALAATRNVKRYPHLDVGAVEKKLRHIRATDTQNAVLVVTEGLFSMDSDIPDLRRLHDLCQHYQAILLVDVAHDFGSLGEGGGGSLAMQNMLGKVDLVMGAFSKTFASNGGFLATRSPAVKQYVKWFGGPHCFSNALGPVQSAVVTKALEIVRSAEGDRLRADLMRNVNILRDALREGGIACLGEPSAVVPVPVASERVARRASAIVTEKSLFVNLVEFPGVAAGTGRFRMQAMATHTPEQVRQAAAIMLDSIAQAQAMEAAQPASPRAAA